MAAFSNVVLWVSWKILWTCGTLNLRGLVQPNSQNIPKSGPAGEIARCSATRKTIAWMCRVALTVVMQTETSNPVSAIFSERELTFTFAICYRPSVCRLSVVCLSVTFVRPTKGIQIFGNISTALGTSATRWHPLKISRRSSLGNPSAGGVKHKRGSQV